MTIKTVKSSARYISTAIAILSVALLLTGCGGGGGGGAVSTPSARQVGSMTVRFEFPQSAHQRSTGREAAKVPGSTASIVITVTNAAENYTDKKTLTPSENTVTFKEIPVGRASVEIIAKDAEGTIVASRTELVNISSGATTQLETVLGISITDDGLVPRDLEVNVGEQIVWVNNSSNVISVNIPGTDCAMTLKKNGVLSCTFTSPVEVSYTDAITPSLPGSIRVVYSTMQSFQFADASADTTLGAAPLAVNLNAFGVITGSDSLTYAWNFGDGTSAAATPLSTFDRAMNTVSHIYTSAGSYEAVLTISNGTAAVTSKIRIFVESGSPVTPIAGTEPTAAKAILFGQTDENLSEEEALQARAELLKVLEVEPGNAEANFLMGMVSLLLEGQRIYDVLDTSVDDGNTLFPFTHGSLPVIQARVAGALVPSEAANTGVIQNFIGTAGTRSAAAVISDTSDPDDIQAELFRVAANVDASVYYMKVAAQYLESNPSQKFIIPRDIFSPELKYFIDKGDLEMIVGILSYLKAFIYAGTAYNMEDGGFDWDATPVDSDESGYIEPYEYLPTGIWGTLRSDGAQRLTKAKASLEDAITYINSGIDYALGETSEENEFIPVGTDPEMREDLLSLKNAMQFVYNLTHIDTKADSNLSDIVIVNLGAFFDSPAPDWKTLAPTCFDHKCRYVKRNSAGIPSVPDPTFSGLIPDGIPNSAWIEMDNVIGCVCAVSQNNAYSKCNNAIADGMTIPQTCPIISSAANSTGQLAPVTGLSTLFNSESGELSSEQFITAKNQINSYLTAHPNDADANMAAFFAAFVDEADAQAQVTGNSFFPFSYDISQGVFDNAGVRRITAGALYKAMESVNPAIGVEAYRLLTQSAPRITGRAVTPFADPDNPTYQEYLREATTFAASGGTADQLVAYLDKVIAAIASTPSWKFDIPATNKTTSEVWYSLDAGDIHILKGVIRYVQAWILYAAAYDWTGIDDIDINAGIVFADAQDGTATPADYLPPSPFGELTNRSYITRGKTLLLEGENEILTGIDLTQAETSDVNELLPYHSDPEAQKSIDEAEYAMKALKAMFDGVQVPLPANEDKNIITIVDLSVLFNNPISNWRSIAPTYNADSTYTLPDRTMGGLFPNGFPGPAAFYETGPGYYCFGFYFEGDSSSHAAYNYYGNVSITATLGDMEASNDSLSCYVEFPSEITVNTLTGTIINISGTSNLYAPRTGSREVNSSYSYGEVSLPASFSGKVRVYDLNAGRGWYQYPSSVMPINVPVMLLDDYPIETVYTDGLEDGVIYAGYPIISSMATDTGIIKTFDLYVDNAMDSSTSAFQYYQSSVGNVMTGSFKLDTTKYSNGTHSIKIRGTDGGGNSTFSQTFSVTINNASVGSVAGHVTLEYGSSAYPTRIGAFYETTQGTTIIAGAANVDANGNFILSKLPPGAYQLIAFNDINNNQIIDYSEYCGIYDGTVTVEAGSALTGKNLTIASVCYSFFY